MLKVELHAHTSDDPKDDIPYTVHDLIDRASHLGFQALAVTLHDSWQDVTPLRAYAQKRAIVLISGIERTIQGKHVLLLNFGCEAGVVDSFDALSALRLREPAGLVIAPHAFYPGRTCLGRLLDRYPALFDAIEFNGFYTPQFNAFNGAAVDWARRHGKPVVANTDLHRLSQLGRTYSLVDADPDPAAICAAIKAGKVEIFTTPLGFGAAAFHICDLLYCEFAKTPRAQRGGLSVHDVGRQGRILADRARASNRSIGREPRLGSPDNSNSGSAA